MPRRSPEKLDSIAEVPEEDAMAAKRGRPTKPADERRSEALGLRMTAEEKAFLVAAAESFGMPVSAFVLQTVRAYLAGNAPPTSNRETLTALLRRAADALETEKNGRP